MAVELNKLSQLRYFFRYWKHRKREGGPASCLLIFPWKWIRSLLFHVYPISIAIIFARLVFRTVFQLKHRMNLPVVMALKMK